jgi:hypothetical protein
MNVARASILQSNWSIAITKGEKAGNRSNIKGLCEETEFLVRIVFDGLLIDRDQLLARSEELDRL